MERSVNHSSHSGDDDNFDLARPRTLAFNIRGTLIEHGTGGLVKSVGWFPWLGLDALGLTEGVDVLVVSRAGKPRNEMVIQLCDAR